MLAKEYRNAIALKYLNKGYAYAAVTTADGFGLGVAVLGEPGYLQLPTRWISCDSYESATSEATALNTGLGLTAKGAAEIVLSSMQAPTQQAQMA